MQVGHKTADLEFAFYMVWWLPFKIFMSLFRVSSMSVHLCRCSVLPHLALPCLEHYVPAYRHGCSCMPASAKRVLRKAAKQQYLHRTPVKLQPLLNGAKQNSAVSRPLQRVKALHVGKGQ